MRLTEFFCKTAFVKTAFAKTAFVKYILSASYKLNNIHFLFRAKN